jgi:hypothetical protein
MNFPENFVASPFAAAIGWTLLHSLWEGALLAALLGTVLLATRSPARPLCSGLFRHAAGVRRIQPHANSAFASWRAQCAGFQTSCHPGRESPIRQRCRKFLGTQSRRHSSLARASMVRRRPAPLPAQPGQLRLRAETPQPRRLQRARVLAK